MASGRQDGRLPPLFPPNERAPSRQTGAISIRHYDDGVNPFADGTRQPGSMRELLKEQRVELLQRYAEAEVALGGDEGLVEKRRVIDVLPLATSVLVCRSPASIRTDMVMRRVEKERSRRDYRKYRDELAVLERRAQMRLRLTGISKDKGEAASARTSRRPSATTESGGDNAPLDYEGILRSELGSMEQQQLGAPPSPRVPSRHVHAPPQPGPSGNQGRKAHHKDDHDDTTAGKFGALKPEEYLALREEHERMSQEGAWLRSLSEHSAPPLSLGGIHVPEDLVKRLIRPDMFVPLHPLILALYPSLTPEKLLAIHRYLGLSVDDQLRASGAYRVTKESTSPASARGARSRPTVIPKKKESGPSDLPLMAVDNNRQLRRLFTAGLEQFCRGAPKMAKRSQERGMGAAEFVQFCLSNHLLSKADAQRAFDALAVEASKPGQGPVMTVHEVAQIGK